MKNWILRFRKEDIEMFEDLKKKVKEIETRAATPRYQKIKLGDTITFTCDSKQFIKEISNIYHWKNIDEMVSKIPFKKIMPRVRSIGEVRKAYSSYPNYDEKISKFGIVGFEFK